MRPKTTRVICNSHDPEARPPLALSPLAIEDFTDTPVFTLTPHGLQEMQEAAPQMFPLTPLLIKRLEEFKAARQARESAHKGELGKAILAEDSAALNLAWAFENLVGQDL